MIGPQDSVPVYSSIGSGPIRDWLRLPAVVCALLTIAFQAASEAHAVPATGSILPWLDGRPTTVSIAPAPSWRPDGPELLRFLRFDAGGGPRYGLLEGETVYELRDDLFSPVVPTGLSYSLEAVSVLQPLGPGHLGRVLRLRPRRTTHAEATFLDLGNNPVRGPDGQFPVPAPYLATTQGCIGLIVGDGSPAPAVFGVTAGILLADARGHPQLALGPSVVRGVEFDMLHLLDGVASFAGCELLALLSDTYELIARVQLRRGDVVLVTTANETRHDLSSCEGEASLRVDPVGEIACRLLRADQFRGTPGATP